LKLTARPLQAATVAAIACPPDRAARPRERLVDGSETADVGRMKVRDVIRLIEQNGWFLVATRGSHRQYKHSARPGRVTIAGKPSDDMAPGTLNSVLKQAGLKEHK
jgi:predicted RNA binding protein YcfA (HicA-like mRNA interferase family)